MEQTRPPAATIIFETLELLGRHWWVFAKAVAVPVGAMLAVNLVIVQGQSPGVLLLLGLSAILLQTYIAVTTHRLVLLGPDQMPEWGIRAWSRGDSMFLGYALVLSIGFAVGFAVALAIHAVVLLVHLAASAWVWCRVCPIFPATAVGDDASLASAWAMTRAHQPTMLVCVLALPLVLSVPASLLGLVHPMVGGLAQSVVTVVTVAVLSRAYRHLKSAG